MIPSLNSPHDLGEGPDGAPPFWFSFILSGVVILPLFFQSDLSVNVSASSSSKS